MLKIRSIFALSILVFLSLACENEQELKKGKLEFAFESSSASGKTGSPESLRFLVITVEDESGNIVFNRKKIELFKFAETYLSEPLEFPAGEYLLTEFLVLDEEGEVQYATPQENSRLAHLVSNPLPIDFTITEDQTTKVTPEVVSIDEFTAEDFGYSTFSFDIVETISFQLAVFVYNESTDNFELTSSEVQVTSSEQSLYDQPLPDSTIRVVVKDGFENYTLHVNKSGYTPYVQTFTKDSLAHYHSGAVLKVILWTGGNTLLNGLVGYYPFSGNANDESPEYDHHGSVFEAALTTDRKGNANSAYYFDGINDYISIEDNDATDFDRTDDFSISVWASVKMPQPDPNQQIYDIIRKWRGQLSDPAPYGISYLNGFSPLPNRFYLSRYDGQSCGNSTNLSSGTISTEEWHHIVMVKEGTTIRFYVDNQKVDELQDNSVCNTSNNVHITIGTRGQLIRFFNGKIDDIRFYNRSISSEEIELLYSE